MAVFRTHTVSLPERPTFTDLYQLQAHEWDAFPTLAQGQTHDLKYEGAGYRVWRSRMSPLDYDTDDGHMRERIMFEQYVDGRWLPLDRYGRRMG